jgi:hypothetical protein
MGTSGHERSDTAKTRGAPVSARGGRAFSALALAVLAAILLSLTFVMVDPADAKKKKNE